jgi:predicted dienelactone hydrolase
MPNAWLSGGIDTKKIGVSGLSLGGLNTLLVTYHPTLRDPRIKAAAAMAPASCWLSEAFYETVKPPLLLLDGDQDLITPIETNAARTFERARSPRHLVTMTHATHTAFSGFFAGSSPTSYDAIACPCWKRRSPSSRSTTRSPASVPRASPTRPAARSRA